MYLYLLFDKAEALDAFKVFKNRGREEKKRKMVRSDMGG
jgi:hypothetical protein